MVRAALAVCAHPDDETFGLGAVLATLLEAGTDVEALCFTRGEASTLGRADDLREVRQAELDGAARVLGLRRHELLAYPDGRLDASPSATSPPASSPQRSVKAASCWWCSTTAG